MGPLLVSYNTIVHDIQERSRIAKLPNADNLQKRFSAAFYNSPITKPVVCARIIEIGSHLTKRVPVQSHS